MTLENATYNICISFIKLIMIKIYEKNEKLYIQLLLIIIRSL